jgi:hypothetical protein
MYEIIDFLGPGEQGVSHCPLMDDHLGLEGGAVSQALACYAELSRQNLCAELTTLNHYGLGGFGCALVDGIFALAVESGRAIRAIGGPIAD